MVEKIFILLSALIVLSFGCDSSSSLSSPWYCDSDSEYWVYPNDYTLADDEELSFSSGKYQFLGNLDVESGGTLSIQGNASVKVNGTLTFLYGSYLITALSHIEDGVEVTPLSVEGCTFFNGTIIINDSSISTEFREPESEAGDGSENSDGHFPPETTTENPEFSTTTGDIPEYDTTTTTTGDLSENDTTTGDSLKRSKDSTSKTGKTRPGYGPRSSEHSSDGSIVVTSLIISDDCAYGDFSEVDLVSYSSCVQEAKVSTDSIGVNAKVTTTCPSSSTSNPAVVIAIVSVIIISAVLVPILVTYFQKRDSSPYNAY